VSSEKVKNYPLYDVIIPQYVSEKTSDRGNIKKFNHRWWGPIRDILPVLRNPVSLRNRVSSV
jgi:hypothetical protein